MRYVIAALFTLVASAASAQSLYPLYPTPYQPLSPYQPVTRTVAPTIPPYRPSSGTTTDLATGSIYSWHRDLTGTTTVNGSNLNTGSLWQTRIQPNGSQSGTDSRGNYWNYNAQTGTYMNLSTGVMCVGTGAARTCF